MTLLLVGFAAWIVAAALSGLALCLGVRRMER
jgi:hypothetical protein